MTTKLNQELAFRRRLRVGLGACAGFFGVLYVYNQPFGMPMDLPPIQTLIGIALGAGLGLLVDVHGPGNAS